jgi:hypothetical protein
MGNNGAVHHRLTKLFHQIKDEGRLSRTIDVQETGERFQARVEHRTPHLRVENAVAVVKQRIHGIRSTAMFAPEDDAACGPNWVRRHDEYGA